MAITIIEVVDQTRNTKAWRDHTAAEAYAERLKIQRERIHKPREVDGWIEYHEPVGDEKSGFTGTKRIRIRFEDDPPNVDE